MSRGLLATLLASSLLATSAIAQTAGGRIEGIVLGPDGLPAADARVSLRSPTQIGGAKRQTTDASGEFRFVGLIPGTFSVTVEKPGHKADERKDIYVGVNRTVSLTFLLESQEPTPVTTAPAETYVIKAERPVVDSKRTSLGESMPSEFAQEVPVLHRRPQTVTEFAPGVVGGGNPNIRGGATFNNSYTVDGVDTTDPVTHTFGTNFNFDAVADVEVQTAGMGAEYGAVTGGVANIVTRSGSNDLQVDASVYAQHDKMTLDQSGHEVGEFREENVNVNLSGPIVRDRLWYFASVQLDDRVDSIPCDADQLGVEGLCPHPARERLGVLYLGKLTFQASPTHKFQLWTQGEQTGIDNLTQEPTTAPEAERHQDQSTQIYSAAWEWVPTRSLFLKTQANVQRQRLEVYPQSGDFDTPGLEADEITGIESGNYTRIVDDIRYRAGLSQTLTLFLDRLALPMEPRAGYKFNYMRNPSSDRVTGDLSFRRSGGVPESGTRTIYCTEFDGSFDRGDPRRCTVGPNKTTTQGVFASGFMEDTLKFTRWVSVTPGVGLHYGETFNFKDESVTRFITPTPHVNATWDPTRDGRTVVRAGYNQYVDLGFLSIPGFVGRQHVQERCEYNAASGEFSDNCVRFGGESGVTIGRPFGPNGPERELRAPRTHEVLVGAEREVTKGFSAGTEFVYRKYVHQFEDIETNVNWNEQGDDAESFRDPEYPGQFIFDLETPDEARRSYVGASFMGRRFVGNWNFLGSYTWARSRGTVNEGFATVYLDNPTNSAFWEGYLPDDRRHTIKFQTSYQLTKSWNLGMTFFYGTGTPYSKRHFNQLYDSFTDLRSPRGTDPGDPNDPDDDVEARLPDLTEINVKSVYNLKRLTGFNLDLIGEIFNLLNTATVTEVEERNLDENAPVRYGEATDRQDPFRLRVGLRYRY